MIVKGYMGLFAAIAFTVAGCSVITGRIKLDIPDQVKMQKGQDDLLVPGTQVMITPPAGFPPLPSLGRFEKDPDNFIEVSESLSSSYYKRKSHVDAVMDAAKARGMVLYYEKEFNFGPYRAYLVYGPENNPDDGQMVLILGNDNFVATVSGVFPRGDRVATQAVFKSLMTAVVDPTVKPDESIFAPFILDLSRTRFKYADHSGRTYFYTIDGLGAPKDNILMDQVQLNVIPAMSKEAVQTYARGTLDLYNKVGFVPSSQDITDTVLHGLYANQEILKGKLKGHPATIYQLVSSNNKEGILFCGIALDNRDSLTTHYGNIASTLILK